MLVLLITAALAADATLEADRVVWEDGVATAEGHVRVTLGDDTVEAQVATYDRATGRVQLQRGTWTREAGTLVFESAELSVTDRTGHVTDGRFEADGVEVTGDTLGWSPEGTLVGTGVRYTPCACDGVEPWGVSARRVELKPGEWVRFGPGALRVLERPVVPIPGASLPLKRRSGLLAPAVGYGQDGLIAMLPAYITLGRSADTTLTPEVRTGRGARMLGEVRYALRGGEGELDVSGGYDFTEEQDKPRAGGRWTHRWTDGTWWTAFDGQLTSDATYDRTYRDRYLDRALPFREVRGLVGIGLVELTTDVFQGPDPTRQELFGLRIRPRTVVHRGLVATGEARLRGIRGSDHSIQRGPSSGYANGRLRVERPVGTGPFVVNPRLDLYARTATVAPNGARWSWASAAFDARLPLWRAESDSFERLEPSIEVGAVAGVPVTWDPALDVLPPEGPVWAAPGLLYRRTGKALLEARLGAHLTPDGAWARVDGAARLGGLDARLQLRGLDGLDLGNASVSYARGWVRPTASWTWLAPELAGVEVHQVKGLLALGPPELQVTGGVLADVTGDAWLSRTAGVTWKHPSGCVTLGTQARFDSDRALPDLSLVFDVQPVPKR